MKHMKPFIITGAILLVIGAVLLMIGLIKRRTQNHYFVDGPGMERKAPIRSVYYNVSGDSLGSLYRIELSDSSVSFTRCEGNGCRTVTKTYDVPYETYSRLEVLVRDYNMKSWTDLPPAEFFAYDAPTTSLTITFYDDTVIQVSSLQQLPESGWDAINGIVSILEETQD